MGKQVSGKRNRHWLLILIVILLTIMAGGLIYAFCIYNGYLQMNHPSRDRYPVRGVDISRYQGKVEWETLAGEDIQFAYIKATEGSSHIDEQFADNWEQAAGSGLKTGVYHFFSFDSPGQTQAEHFTATVGIREEMLPPVIDVEYYGDKKANPPDPTALREQLQVMLDQVEAYYQTVPVIYSTEDVWETYLKGYFDRYPLWIRNVFTKPDEGANWTFWQYSNRGRLDGYSGEENFIDLNVFFGDVTDWEQWTNERAVVMPETTESLFVQLAGTWHIDGETTNRYLEANGNQYHSLQQIFGTGIQHGSQLTIQEDGAIEYYIGIGNGGTGQGEISGDEVHVTITPYEDHSSEEEILTMHLETEDDKTYLVMDFFGETLYWIW